MLDHSFDLFKVIPFAVLGASLLGSTHCVAMCGGLVISVVKSKVSLVQYHLGRLLGYTGLGGLAGLLGATLLGERAFHTPFFSILSCFTTGLMAFGFIYLGFRVWTGQALHLFRVSPRFYSIFQKIWGQGPFATGLLSAFLPCGWLHTFVLGAVATQSPSVGAVYLVFFWLGTLPALSLTPWVVSGVFRPLSKKAPRASAFLLICMGLLSLGLKLIPEVTHSSCHLHQMDHP